VPVGEHSLRDTPGRVAMHGPHPAVRTSPHIAGFRDALVRGALSLALARCSSRSRSTAAEGEKITLAARERFGSWGMLRGVPHISPSSSSSMARRARLSLNEYRVRRPLLAQLESGHDRIWR
jgi:hypothetical protein